VNTDLGKQITNSKFGIVVHTEYKGNNIEKLSQNFNINVNKYKNNKDVWLIDAYVKDNTANSMIKGKQKVIPVTVIECPPIKIFSVRFYKNKKTLRIYSI
jgi:hypothetical protein